MRKKRERQTIINGVSIGVNRYPDPTERKRKEKERTLQHQAEASKGGVGKREGEKEEGKDSAEKHASDDDATVKYARVHATPQPTTGESGTSSLQAQEKKIGVAAQVSEGQISHTTTRIHKYIV